jgi:hypothetical protein
MKRFTDAIKKCLETENWYGALFIALAIPDICEYCTSPTVKPGERYIKWFNNYLARYYDYNTASGERVTWMSASDCYALRCAILHSGIDDITGQNAKDTLDKFYLNTLYSHCIKTDGKLSISIYKFCNQVIKAVDEWITDIKDNEDAQNKIRNLMTIHDPGTSPPIIAVLKR